MHHAVVVPLLCLALLIPDAEVCSQQTAHALSLARSNAVVIYRGDDGVIGLDSYTPITPAADGSIIVLDRRGGGVFSFKHGRPLQRIGRQGSGPGEFREPIAAGWLNDTLWVSDKQTQRVRALSGTKIWSVREDASGEMEIVQEALQSPKRLPQFAPM